MSGREEQRMAVKHDTISKSIHVKLFAYLWRCWWLEVDISEIGGSLIAQRNIAGELRAETHQWIGSTAFRLDQVLETHLEIAACLLNFRESNFDDRIRNVSSVAALWNNQTKESGQ